MERLSLAQKKERTFERQNIDQRFSRPSPLIDHAKIKRHNSETSESSLIKWVALSLLPGNSLSTP